MISFVWSVITSLIRLIMVLKNYFKDMEKKRVIREQKINTVDEVVEKIPVEKPAQDKPMSTDEILKELISKEEDEDFKKVLEKLMK